MSRPTLTLLATLAAVALLCAAAIAAPTVPSEDPPLLPIEYTSEYATLTSSMSGQFNNTDEGLVYFSSSKQKFREDVTLFGKTLVKVTDYQSRFLFLVEPFFDRRNCYAFSLKPLDQLDFSEYLFNLSTFEYAGKEVLRGKSCQVWTKNIMNKDTIFKFKHWIYVLDEDFVPPSQPGWPSLFANTSRPTNVSGSQSEGGKPAKRQRLGIPVRTWNSVHMKNKGEWFVFQEVTKDFFRFKIGLHSADVFNSTLLASRGFCSVFRREERGRSGDLSWKADVAERSRTSLPFLELHVERHRNLSNTLVNDGEAIRALNQRRGASAEDPQPWEAGPNERFDGMFLSDLLHHELGTWKLLGGNSRGLPKLTVGPTDPWDSGDLPPVPREFDARAHWPGCVHPVQDQGQCGSCWAHSAVSALADRLCARSQGRTNVTLSVQHMINCNRVNGGCHGGFTDSAWVFLSRHGVPSDECVPYLATDDACGRVCQPASNSTELDVPAWAVFKTINAFTPGEKVEDIQREIMTNGPVQASFYTFDDFSRYKTGVYQRSPSSAFMGGHSVKIIGWGRTPATDTDPGTDYWLAINSWGPRWGEGGMFKIRRGVNECGIEDEIATGLVDA